MSAAEVLADTVPACGDVVVVTVHVDPIRVPPFGHEKLVVAVAAVVVVLMQVVPLLVVPLGHE
jgi:hypothetical protein